MQTFVKAAISSLFLICIVFEPITAFAGVKKSLELKLKDLSGSEVQISKALKTNRVVLNFWASWCTSCAEEVPQLKDLQKKYPHYSYFGVNVGEASDKAKKFVHRNDYPYPVALDEKERLARDFGVDGLPVTIVLEKGTGEVLFRGNRPPSEVK